MNCVNLHIQESWGGTSHLIKILQQTGDENIQTYLVEAAILI